MRRDNATRTASSPETRRLRDTALARRYLGEESDEVCAIAEAAKCDLYLLTGDEVPFVQDGLRDGEHVRREMHSWFVGLSKH